jgi:hypothetical protein
MKDDKCREAWEKWIENDDYTEQECAFARIESSLDWDKATAFHAGYHARPIPSVEEIEKVIYDCPNWTYYKQVAKEVHRLLVGEEGE